MESVCEIDVNGKSFRQFFGLVTKIDSDCIVCCVLTMHDLTFYVYSRQECFLAAYEIKFSCTTTFFNFCRSSTQDFTMSYQFDINALIKAFKRFNPKSNIKLAFANNNQNIMYIMAQSMSADIIFDSICIEHCSYQIPNFCYNRFSATKDDPNVKITKDTMKVFKKHLDEISSPELRIYDQGASLHVHQSAELPKFVIGSSDYEDAEADGKIELKSVLIGRTLKTVLQTFPTFAETTLFKIYHQIGLPLLSNFDTLNGSIKFYNGIV